MTTKIIIQCIANARGKWRHSWYWDETTKRKGMSARRCHLCHKWWDDVHAAWT